jgi:hypothetical protein
MLWVAATVLPATTSSSAAFAAPRVEESYIYANDTWQSAYISLRSGESALVTISGRWHNGSRVWVNATGYRSWQDDSFNPNCKYPRTKHLPFGRLIGMMGVSASNFQIIDAGVTSRFRVYGPGRLYFRINERDGPCLDNNDGYIHVTVYPQRQ